MNQILPPLHEIHLDRLLTICPSSQASIRPQKLGNYQIYLLIEIDGMYIHHSMGTHALLDKLNSSLTRSTGLREASIRPPLNSSWISMCSCTTSALALKRTIESPSLMSILLGKKALAIPVESPITQRYLMLRPPTV